MVEEKFGLSKFRLTKEEADMVSLPGRTEARDAVFARLVYGQPTSNRMVVVDAFSNVGTDGLAFMAQAAAFRRRITLICVQRSVEEDRDPRQERFLRMRDNLTDFYNLGGVKEYVQLGMEHEFVRDFIGVRLAELCIRSIDLLYMDPPWHLPEGFCLANDRGTDKKPSAPTLALVGLLAREVFAPLHAVGYPPPRIVCIKAPTPFVQFSLVLFEAAPYLRANNYALFESITVRNRRGSICMYFHILTRADAGPVRLDPTASAFVPSV